MRAVELAQIDMGKSTESNLGGTWVRSPKGEAAVVFVHGILTKAQNAWGRPNIYWPDLDPEGFLVEFVIVTCRNQYSVT